MALSISDTELIQRAIASAKGDMYTSLPGRVEVYYPDSQTADVAPTVERAVPRADGGLATETLPLLTNVKVCFPQAGPFSITWPLNKGDHVILLFMTYAIGQWRKTGETSGPGDLRTHSLGSSLALPMLSPNKDAVPSNVAEQDALVLAGPMIMLGGVASDFAALASKCDANFQKIKNLLSGWTVAPGDGGGALKTASASLSFDPVACSRVKVL